MQQRSKAESGSVEAPYLICVQDSIRNFYLKQKLQIVIFGIVFFYLNQQNPEKMKNSKFLQVSTNNNNNESPNALILSFAPKRVFSGAKTVKIASYLSSLIKPILRPSWIPIRAYE